VQYTPAIVSTLRCGAAAFAADWSVTRLQIPRARNRTLLLRPVGQLVKLGSCCFRLRSEWSFLPAS
jgi:hypothetical protein